MPAPLAAAPAAECRLGGGTAPGDTLDLVITDDNLRLGPPAPASTAAERMIGRLLYRGLVRSDCRGRVLPDLASSWRRTGAGWEFRIESAARFADGSDVTAAAIQAAFERRPVAGVASVEAAGAVLRLRGSSAESDAVFLARLTAASAVVAGPSRAGDAPALETGDYRWAGASGSRGRTVTFLTERNGPGVIRLETAVRGDPRDRLDGGTGTALALVTRDPVTLDYAGRRPGVSVDSLGWDLVYGLVVTGAVVPPDGAVRASLARDAVRAPARAATDSGCRGRDTTAAARPVIGYPEADPIARGLAERIVSLARAAPPWLGPAAAPGLTAAGFRTGALDQAAAGLAAVVRTWPLGSACPADLAPGTIRFGLVETRPALVRTGPVPALMRDGEGTLVLARRAP
ncbi:MAG: hypothetical protein AB7S39_17160 [Gemmatimonadales bacterium]